MSGLSSAALQRPTVAREPPLPKGERLVLRAKKAAGVPLHPEPESTRVSGRLPDGAEVEVVEAHAGGRWIRVRAADGTLGWVTRRYLASRRAPEPTRRSLARDSPWASREACEGALRAGKRLPRTPGQARLAAWNIRWFPDGGPGIGRSRQEPGTDLEWLACALAYLDPDVIALSEIKAYPGARQKLTRVLERWGTFVGGRFEVRLDDCAPPAAQHVALVWNTRRARAAPFEVYGELNPRGAPCRDHLRPGLGAHFRFTGGLDVEVVAVHLKSGRDARAAALRRTSWAALNAVRARSLRRHGDADLVLLGDFNAMGCSDCSPASSGQEELAELGRLLSGPELTAFVVPTEPACTHYFSGTPSLLDIAVAPRAMQELGVAPVARVSGVCAELACGPAQGTVALAAHERLSDHCPLVLDLVDRDLDE